MPADQPLLVGILERARDRGFLGPGDVGVHLRLADEMGEVVEQVLGAPPTSFADLGTGGGVPGLVLASRWRGARAVLVDSNHRRCEALRDAVVVLGLDGRAEVVEARAEAAAHSEALRARFQVVTARGFASPPVTAEIASGFVADGGIVVVSDPPDPAPERWPAGPLAELGFAGAVLRAGSEGHFAILEKVHPTPVRYPRGVGKPAKRPLW
jgi:16S rRNA (guanine527-N7)-methyltransferase